jgi:pimeloyl-ACP methyl ester carboxylesterase
MDSVPLAPAVPSEPAPRSRTRWIYWLWGAVILFVAVSGFLGGYYKSKNRETTTVEAARRTLAAATDASSTGTDSFIPLSSGMTHYRWDGAEGRPIVVLVHGFMDSMADWDAVVPSLLHAGFRVLRLDLAGHGLSDRPVEGLSRAMLSQQVFELIDRLHLARVDIIGHSLGGAITVDFTSKHPERVRRMGLLAPAVRVDLSTLRLLRVPWVGPYLAHTFFMGKVEEKLSPHASRGEAWAAAAIAGQRIFGSEAAYLSVLTGDGFSDYVPACEVVGRQRRHVLLAWGTGDELIFRPAIDAARHALGQVEWSELPGAPHELPMLAPTLVAPLLVKFLNAPDQD